MVKSKRETVADSPPNQFGHRVGRAFVIQEALGYIIGTVIAETPFELSLGEDAVWVRDMGAMTQAMSSGNPNEFHHIPFDTIKDHAIRHIWPWPHEVPA